MVNGFTNTDECYEYLRIRFIILSKCYKAKDQTKDSYSFCSACDIICIMNAICQFISYNIVSNDIKKKNFFT